MPIRRSIVSASTGSGNNGQERPSSSTSTTIDAFNKRPAKSNSNENNTCNDDSGHRKKRPRTLFNLNHRLLVSRHRASSHAAPNNNTAPLSPLRHKLLVKKNESSGGTVASPVTKTSTNGTHPRKKELKDDSVSKTHKTAAKARSNLKVNDPVPVDTPVREKLPRIYTSKKANKVAAAVVAEQHARDPANATKISNRTTESKQSSKTSAVVTDDHVPHGNSRARATGKVDEERKTANGGMTPIPTVNGIVSPTNNSRRDDELSNEPLTETVDELGSNEQQQKDGPQSSENVHHTALAWSDMPVHEQIRRNIPRMAVVDQSTSSLAEATMEPNQKDLAQESMLIRGSVSHKIQMKLGKMNEHELEQMLVDDASHEDVFLDCVEEIEDGNEQGEHDIASSSTEVRVLNPTIQSRDVPPPDTIITFHRNVVPQISTTRSTDNGSPRHVKSGGHRGNPGIVVRKSHDCRLVFLSMDGRELCSAGPAVVVINDSEVCSTDNHSWDSTKELFLSSLNSILSKDTKNGLSAEENLNRNQLDGYECTTAIRNTNEAVELWAKKILDGI